MTSLLKRGNTYHFHTTVAGTRLRGSLGTSDPKAAKALASKVGVAVTDPKSEVWPTLRAVLPKSSYQTLAEGLHVKASPDLIEFEILFNEQLDRREKLGSIAASTHTMYAAASANFFKWLAEKGVRKMEGVSPTVVEQYQVWRAGQLGANPKARNGAGLIISNTVMTAIFALGVQEGVLSKSPLLSRMRLYGSKKLPSPFSQTDLWKMEDAAKGEERTIFLILKYTGFRGSDAVSVTWDAVNLTDNTVSWETKKRSVWVRIPLAKELRDHLVQKYEREQPDLKSPILGTMGREKLYRIVQYLGKKAGINHCNPHRFRATIATQMLSDGLTIWDVAKFLGDSVAVVEKYYAAQTEGQIEKARGFLDREAA